jgi:hypothetical protein
MKNNEDLQPTVQVKKQKTAAPKVQIEETDKVYERKGLFGLRMDVYTVGLFILLIFIAVLRLRIINTPLERDEGEYAYLGKLLLQGIAPYKAAYNMKLPGTYGMYALIMGLFGQTVPGIHFGFTLINLLTISFFFFAFRNFFNSSIALFAASVYGILSFSPFVLGFAAHATHFVNFFVSIGWLYLSFYYKNKRTIATFFAGLMFGLAFLMKQQAVFFLLFGGLSILIIAYEKRKEVKDFVIPSLVFSFAVFIPYILTVLALYIAGAFDKFWFWTFKYAREYASSLSFEQGKSFLTGKLGQLAGETPAFWILSIAGLAILGFIKMSAVKKTITGLYIVFAAASVCPGFFFRPHYFVLVLPAVGLSGGIFMFYASSWLKERTGIAMFSKMPLVFFLIVVIALFKQGTYYYFEVEPETLVRNIYGANPFVESVEIGEYISNNSRPSDKIAIFGSEPQILLYSGRNSATGHIYMYGLMEHQPYNLSMQKEMAAEVEKGKPKFLVFCSMHFSWIKLDDSPNFIFDWYNNYNNQYYDVVGIVDFTDSTAPKYYWNDDIRNFQQKGQEYIIISKRRT